MLAKVHPTLGVLKELGRRVFLESGDSHSTQHLLQHLSVAVQRGNAAAVPGSATAVLGGAGDWLLPK